MELPPQIYRKVEALSNEGDDLCDNEEFDAAISKWSEALDLIPEPKLDWEASTWLQASIGDAHYQKGQVKEARELFFDALNCPEGQANPFIHYRLGQCEIQIGNRESGIEHLLQAYMLDGENIFSDEDDGQEYLNILKTQGLLP